MLIVNFIQIGERSKYLSITYTTLVLENIVFFLTWTYC